jgi:glutathione S-transferase
MSSSRKIILFHYHLSPYSKRVVWYLALRRIAYTECVSFPAWTMQPHIDSLQLQPTMLPRPDISALGIAYRRIPLLAIGRDIYADTRLILDKLDALFPPSPEHPPLIPAGSDPAGEAIRRLLSVWAIDGFVFLRASQLFAASAAAGPALRNARFRADREQLTGHRWDPSAASRIRPEAMADMRHAFDLLESTLLSDEREWLLRTKTLSMADIEGMLCSDAVIV